MRTSTERRNAVRGRAPLVEWCALVCVGVASAGCGGAEPRRPAGPESGLAEAASPRVLAEATADAAPLRVQIVGARRVSADSVRIDFVLARPAAAGVEGQGDQAAVETAVAALDGASLVSADGHRRVFPLQDPSGRPVGGALQVPEPGGRQTAWMVFTGHPRNSGTVTLVLPGFPPIRSIPVL